MTFYIKNIYIIVILLIFYQGARVGSTSFHNLRPVFCKHTEDDVNKSLNGYRGAPFNHPWIGWTDFYVNSEEKGSAPCPPKFRELKKQVHLGHGSKVFKRASDIMFNFKMINQLPWAKVHVSSTAKTLINRRNSYFFHQSQSDASVGDAVLCTLVRCYGLVWALNPCRLVTVYKSPTVSSIAFSTLKGHLIAGEERFTIRTLPGTPKDVIFEMHSVTRGSGILGSICMPFIRPLQRRFFNEQAMKMQELCSE